MSNELFFKSAAELGELLDKKEISAVELIQSVIDRTKKIEPRVQAFLATNEEKVIAEAKASDERRAAGKKLSPLDGIPVATKDILADKGVQLTCASKILKNYISPYTSTAIERLRDAGAIMWGRTNLDEFAMGSSVENSAFQATHNPWDLERIPGGSSGGSSAAVAAGETIIALGSDTGGSIRQPAALCGVVGLKPTYGLVSRYGLAAFASSLDQIGPFARTVKDVASTLQIIAGHDRYDSTSFKANIPNYTESIEKNKGPWKLGVPKEYFGEGLNPEVRVFIEKAIDFYKQQGCEIVEVSLPNADLAIPAYYLTATAEASSNLARYDGIRYTHRSSDATDAIDIYSKSRAEGFGDEVKRRIILGTYVLSSGYYDAYYVRAQKVRTLIRRDFEQAFQRVDALLTPTSPTAAFKIGEKATDPLSMYLSDIYTISINLAGLPGISIPCGFTNNNLPVGLQIIGKPYAEAQLLAIADFFEKAHPHYTKNPSL
ncbi:MAG: aspartyl/glutamyl-tRNA amidotransferase subunit A [Verrucomicrobia bacterium GWC2_42_7]|nr:MAG: aspartyl/glutamyl-tRNA amidotransferase subunit A [Verrucomicrobia bacterium GWC2_42_7]